MEDEAEEEEPLWEPTAPHPFLYGVSQGGTTAPSGAVAPVTLPSHVDGYAEHVDVNHRPYWQALPTAPTAQLAEAFAPPPEPPDSESDSDTDAEEEATQQQQEEGEQSEPEPNRYQKLPPGSGGSGGGSMVPAPRLMRRPSKPPQHATPPFAFVGGAIASGRSVFTRRMPWALKLKLKLDSAEVGLLHTWSQPDDLNDQSLAAVATEYDTAFLLNSSLLFQCLSRACLGKSISFLLHHLPTTI